jgi:LuxR family maltose regulon positive regulatory protein
MTAFWSGRSDDAVEAFEETVLSGARVGNHTARIYALGYLAAIAAERGDAAAAERLVVAATALAERQHLGEHWVTLMAHYAAAQTALARGDSAAARAAADRGLELADRGGLRLDSAYGLDLLARTARADGDEARAHDLRERARRRVAACASPGIMAVRVRGPAPAAAQPTAGQELSARELAVLQLLPTDLSLREIGNELYVSLNTVKTHVRNIYAKLRVSTREDAVARAREQGLLRATLTR